MHVFDAHRRRIELQEIRLAPRRHGAGLRDALREESPLAKAHRAFFEFGRAHAPTPPGPAPSAFREVGTGLVRTFLRELVLRFAPGAPARRRTRILADHGLAVRRTNAFVLDQVVVFDRSRRRPGAELLEAANRLAQLEEVAFATPNFVSEYRRQRAIRVPVAQWHLDNRGRRRGQVAGEDVDAREAWKITRGARSIVVAILDDGVDVDHPNLRANVWRARRGRDRVGRDFFLPDEHPDHFNPRPKKFRFPYDEMEGNDIHGTPCAGVVAASGRGAWGVAPGCRVLAVKVFHADELAPDERVADAIRYAARRADVLSCSWTSSNTPDVQLALADAGRLGRRGRGAAIFCASGNDAARVGFPASDPHAIAVGATTDGARLAEYSNTGAALDLVAPSSGGVDEIFTTDVAVPGRGFNVGRAREGGTDGRHTNEFGGTSSATPLAAGVAALVLSVNPRLARDEVRDVLCATADKIGTGYDARGFSKRFGHGRVNAAQAVTEARRRVRR